MLNIMAKALLTLIVLGALLLLWFSTSSYRFRLHAKHYPGKYRLKKSSLRTSTMHYSFKQAEKEEDEYQPCEKNCSWETYLSNDQFLSTINFRHPFSLEDDQNVTSMRRQLACVPFSFGYPPDKAEQLFPHFEYPLCSEKPSEIRPKLQLEGHNFSMTCENGGPGRYVLHPRGIQLTDQYFQHELSHHFPTQNYRNTPVTDVYGEFAIGSCASSYSNAELRPRHVPEAEERANEARRKREGLGRERQRPLSVVFIAVDSFSRRHFYRKLPATISYLNSLNAQGNYSVFDFKVHNIHGLNSPGNMVPMFTNTTMHFEERPKLKDYFGDNSLWAIAREWGFVTFVGLEYCGSNFLNYMGKRLNVDHHVSTFYCATKAVMGIDMGKDSFKQRCIGPHMSHYYLLNYTHSLTSLYPNSHQFTYIHLEAAHEETGQHGATLDKDLVSFLQSLTRDYGHDRDLAIFLQGDHGMAYGDWHKDVDADQEYRLPALFFLSQTDFLKRINNSFDAMWHNSYRLVTKHDLRASVLALFGAAYGQEYPVHAETYLKNDYVLMKEKIPDWRVCNSSGIDPWMCSCLEPTEEIQSEIIHSFGQSDLEHLLIRIVQEALRLINSQIFTTNSHIAGLICQKLTFEGITRAYGYKLNSKMEQIKLEFSVNELSSARIETIALVGSDLSHKLFEASADWYPLEPYTYLSFNTHIRVSATQIVDLTRKDKYAGQCETISRANGIEAEFCVCHDLDRLERERPGLFAS